MLCKFLHICTLLFILTLDSQAQHASDPEEALHEGAFILAKQSFHEGSGLKARILISYLLEMNNNNEAALKLAQEIRDNRKTRMHYKLIDNGRGYADLVEKIINYLSTQEDTSPEQIDFMIFIGTISHPKFNLASKLKQFDTYLGITKKHFPDFYPEQEEIDILKGGKKAIDLPNKLAGKSPLEKAKEITVEKLVYNPQNILTIINSFNQQYNDVDLLFEVEPDAIPYDDIIDSKGTIKYLGGRFDVTSKNLIFKNVTLLNIIHYIEHTLDVEFIEEGDSFLITTGVRGEGRRPVNFQKAAKFHSEIKRSIPNATKKYDKESVQLSGTITEIKLLSDKLLIELNDHFVVEVDKGLLKSDTVDLIKRALTSSKTSKYLKVLIRGTINIKATRTYITACSSIIAEDIPHFFLNN